MAISDCGCGMRLVKSPLSPDALTTGAWEAVAERLRQNKGTLGDLGGGNHFLDALSPYEGNNLYLLIHTGSRLESGLVDAYVDQPASFDREFSRVLSWAEENRACVHSLLEAELGPLELILDIPHNTYERIPDGGVVIRKGAVHVKPGELNVLPSHMSGDVALVRATHKVTDSLESLSHGTGRAISRADCKPFAETYDYASLRKRVMIPERVDNASLRTEGPFAYRDLDDCLKLLSGYVDLIERFAVIGYMGHL